MFSPETFIVKFFTSPEDLSQEPEIPNIETLEAMNELDAGGGQTFNSLEDFWEQMGISPPLRTGLS